MIRLSVAPHTVGRSRARQRVGKAPLTRVGTAELTRGLDRQPPRERVARALQCGRRGLRTTSPGREPRRARCPSGAGGGLDAGGRRGARDARRQPDARDPLPASLLRHAGRDGVGHRAGHVRLRGGGAGGSAEGRAGPRRPSPRRAQARGPGARRPAACPHPHRGRRRAHRARGTHRVAGVAHGRRRARIPGRDRPRAARAAARTGPVPPRGPAARVGSDRRVRARNRRRWSTS